MLDAKTNTSSDNTTQARTSAREELVPSRYAVRVGEIDVLVVSDGVLPLPTQMLGHNAEPAARAAWLDDMFLPPDAFDWALNVVVVRSGSQTILIDAGLGFDPDLHLPRAGQLIKRLEAAGIDLASVTDVVLTHMHMDHVGGLIVDGVKERLRPDLRIHVAAAEVKFWEAPDFSHTNMPQGFPDALRSAAKRFAKRVPQQSAAVRGGARGGAGSCRPPHRRPHARAQRGPPGVRRRPADVRRRRRVRGGFDQPDWHNGFEHDPEEAARVRVRLLRELAETGELLVATHLPFPSVGRVAVEGDAFRWVPVFWDY